MEDDDDATQDIKIESIYPFNTNLTLLPLKKNAYSFPSFCCLIYMLFLKEI